MVSGQFYPSNKDELKKTIEKFFSSLDVASLKDREIKAGIVPHAGYAFSGKCASFVYKLLRNSDFSSFIILGTNHSGLGSKFTLSIDDFDTPLGIVESDIDLIEEIITKARKENLDIEVDEHAHKYEHSIEVQLPFLQSVQKNFKIIPILLNESSLDDIEKFAAVLADIIKYRKVFVLASSDFTHYGFNYGFMPFREDIRENLHKLDNDIIQQILKLDTKAFFDKARKSTVCGRNAVACLVEIARVLKLKAEKLCYYTSGDISGDYENSVGYASIVFS